MTDPKNTILDLLFGRWRSQILYAGVTLGVFDALADEPESAAVVADRLNLDRDLAYRLLRALGTLGLLREDDYRTFSLTPAGQLLRADHPETLRGVTLLEEGPQHYALWKHLPDMIRDGRQNAFVREFGRMAFEHAAHDPGYGEVFDEAMSSYSATQTAWALEALDDYDMASIGHLCDVAGGQGHLLCGFLEKYPHLRGTVLERPAVLEDEAALWANRRGLADRCDYVGGDMFAAVPAADAYMMKMILHDWNDDECVELLTLQREAASPGGRMFIIEHLVPGPDRPHFAKLFDIHMMCWGTGRERTGEEYAALLQRAGWEYQRTWYPESRMMGVVEGRKA